MLPKPEKTILRRILWPFWTIIYWVYLILFGLQALVVNVCCVCTSYLPKGEWRYGFYQAMLRTMSRVSIWAFRVVGIMHIQYVGFEQLSTDETSKKPILIANHPSLLDVFLFYTKLPNLTCIYKSSLQKTLIKSSMGEQIGYISNARPKQMIIDGAESVAAGKQLLIFPEGTRTESGHLNQLKSGAAGIARRANIGMQTVIIHSGSLNCLSKHQALWKPPTFPIFMRVEVGEIFHPQDYKTSQDLNRAVADYFVRQLGEERAFE